MGKISKFPYKCHFLGNTDSEVRLGGSVINGLIQAHYFFGLYLPQQLYSSLFQIRKQTLHKEKLNGRTSQDKVILAKILKSTMKKHEFLTKNVNQSISDGFIP